MTRSQNHDATSDLSFHRELISRATQRTLIARQDLQMVKWHKTQSALGGPNVQNNQRHTSRWRACMIRVSLVTHSRNTRVICGKEHSRLSSLFSLTTQRNSGCRQPTEKGPIQRSHRAGGQARGTQTLQTHGAQQGMLLSNIGRIILRVPQRGFQSIMQWIQRR